MNKARIDKIQSYIPGTCHCITDTAQGSIAALLPLFITQFGLNYYQVGLIMFVNTTVASVIQPIFGYLADRVRLPIFIPLGMMIAVCSIAAMTYAQSFPLLLLLSLTAGIGSALFHPEGAMLVNRYWMKNIGKEMAKFAVGGNVGFALGPLLVGGAYVWGIHFLLLYIPIGLAGSLAYYWLVQTKKEQLQTAKALPKGQDGSQLDSHSPTTGTNDWKSFGKLFFIIAGRSINFIALNTFIPIFWIHVLHSGHQEANMALTIFYGIGAILTFYGGKFSDSLGFVKVIRWSYILFLPTLIIFTGAALPWIAYAMMIPVAIGVFAPYGPIVVLGQAYLAKNIGFSSGITLGVGVTLGGLVVPAIGGLGDAYGIQMALYTLVPISLLALIASFFIREPEGLKEK